MAMKTSDRSPLPPMNKVFTSQLTETEQERLWGRIDAELDRVPHLRSTASQAHQTHPRMFGSFAATFCTAAALVALGWWTFTGTHRDPDLNALTLAEGEAFKGTQTSAQPKTIAFEDGSQIALRENSQIEVLAMTGDQVLLRLMNGAASFRVEKGGPRTWRIEAGIAAVEVVGTRFSVIREATDVRVHVEEGRVLVRSAQLADGVTRLDAGEAVTVTSDAAAENDQQQVKPTPQNAVSSAQSKLNSTEPRKVNASSSPSESIEILLGRADQARIAGDLSSAIVALQDVVRRFPHDARAPLSSFQLGRIHQKKNDWTQAQRAYSWALEHGSSGTLEEDCYVRLVETQFVLDPRVAEKTAQTYLKKFPSGRHERSIRTMLQHSLTPSVAETAGPSN